MYAREIEIPEGVKAEVNGQIVKIEGEKGSLSKTYKNIFGVKIELVEEDGKNKLKVSSESVERKKKAIVGAVIAHTRNMIKGVTEGYTATLKVLYSHFPVSLKVEGNKVLVQNFLGEKIPRESDIVGEDTKVEVNGQDVIVTGTDIEAVGQTAANMEIATKIRNKDRKVFMDGIFIVQKPIGKTKE
jgi:large subunit ribosomal protein L6